MLSDLCVANSLLNKEGYMQGIDKELFVSLSRLLKTFFHKQCHLRTKNANRREVISFIQGLD